ncbi:hypothetical protein GQ600_6142 [Phytophthora cactorum]|nr:hypothetical protein GQ600_6142 [Phytophthora cactorum]
MPTNVPMSAAQASRSRLYKLDRSVIASETTPGDEPLAITGAANFDGSVHSAESAMDVATYMAMPATPASVSTTLNLQNSLVLSAPALISASSPREGADTTAAAQIAVPRKRQKETSTSVQPALVWTGKAANVLLRLRSDEMSDRFQGTKARNSLLLHGSCLPWRHFASVASRWTSFNASLRCESLTIYSCYTVIAETHAQAIYCESRCPSGHGQRNRDAVKKHRSTLPCVTCGEVAK